MRILTTAILCGAMLGPTVLRAEESPGAGNPSRAHHDAGSDATHRVHPAARVRLPHARPPLRAGGRLQPPAALHALRLRRAPQRHRGCGRVSRPPVQALFHGLCLRPPADLPRPARVREREQHAASARRRLGELQVHGRDFGADGAVQDALQPRRALQRRGHPVPGTRARGGHLQAGARHGGRHPRLILCREAGVHGGCVQRRRAEHAARHRPRDAHGPPRRQPDRP